MFVVKLINKGFFYLTKWKMIDVTIVEMCFFG